MFALPYLSVATATGVLVRGLYGPLVTTKTTHASLTGCQSKILYTPGTPGGHGTSVMRQPYPATR